MAEETRKTLRISEEAVTALLDRLDRGVVDHPDAGKRRSERHSFRAHSIIVQFEEPNGARREIVPTRDLSRDGIGLLLGRYTHTGTRVTVFLTSEHNFKTEVTGRVVRCRYIDGTPMIHDVGVQFDRPLDVALFLSGAVSVNVMLVDDDEMQRDVLSQLLRKSKANVTVTDNVEVALQDAMRHPFELIIVNMLSRNLDGCGLVTQLRDKGYVRPITCVSTFTREEIQQTCARLKCSKCVPVPLNRDSVTLLLKSLKQEPVVSTMAHDLEMADLINKFVADVQCGVNEMELAFNRNDFPNLLRLVRRVSALAGTCGFEVISVRANAVADLINIKAIGGDVRESLNLLVQCCLAARPASLAGDDAAATTPSTVADDRIVAEPFRSPAEPASAT